MADNKTQIIITAKDDTRAALSSVQNGMQALANQTAALGLNLTALSALASGGAMAAMAKEAIDTADAIGKMAQKVGVSTESLSALGYAGKLSDVSMEQLGQGLKKLSVNLNDIAAGGNSDAAAALKALGISAKDSAGNLRNADAVFGDISEAFANMQDGAGKTALAVALFGKSGAELIPMLNAGRDGLRDAADEARQFGLIIGGDAAKAAESFNDNLTRLSSASQGVGQIIAGDLLPPLSTLAQELVNTAKEGNGLANMLSGGLRTIMQTLIVVGSDVAFVFKGIGVEIGGIAAQLTALARLDFNAFKSIGAAMRDDARTARAELDAFQYRIMNPMDKEYVDSWRQPAGQKTAAPTFAPATPGAAASLSEGERLIQQMRDRLRTAQELTEVEKLQEQLADGRYKKMTDAERETALSLAGQLDTRKSINTELDAEAKRMAEITRGQQEEASRLASLIGQTQSGKDAQRMMDENLALSALNAGKIDVGVYDEIIASLREVKKEGKDTFDELQRAIDGWGKQSAGAIADFVINGKSSFADLARSIMADLAQMAIYENLTKPLFSMIGGSGGLLSGLFGGGRATGGPVNPGQYYVVGERGPEVLVPGTSGTVIPNGALGGQSNISISIDASGTRSGNDAGSAGELARRIESAVRNVMMVEKRPGGLLA